MIEGRILYVDGADVWLAKGRCLYRSTDGGKQWRYRAATPLRNWRAIASLNRLSSRFARAGFHHFIKTGEDAGLVFAERNIYRLEPENEVLVQVAPIVGSRPLSVAYHDGFVCYGEYTSNRNRDPVRIFGASDDGKNWEILSTLKDVRHIHGVFYDRFAKGFWVTTGDLDEESALWFTADRFRSLERVIGGSQQYRVVQPLFTDQYVYFGSDAPGNTNYICRMQRDARNLQKLIAVSGPVFYSCKVGGAMFFSTAVEPDSMKRGDNAEVWMSEDGEHWKCVVHLKKDRWSMKYFQYGQIHFPEGPGANDRLWYTPFATIHDGTSHAILTG